MIESRKIRGQSELGLVNGGEFCTFGFWYSDGQVARPGDRPGREQKAKSEKKKMNEISAVDQP